MQKVLSLRDSVKGAVVELLSDEGMSCLMTQDGLVSLVDALAHYTEEGRALFPEVYIFDDLNVILKLIPGAEHVQIGEGPKTAHTMKKGLKKCAPLARAGWSVYIERRQQTFAYGVLRSGSTHLAVGPTEILVERGTSEIPVLLIHQVGANVIEIKGGARSALLVNFGATRDSEASPIPVIRDFVETIVTDVSQSMKEQVATFYRGVMLDVLHSAHGTLAAVVGAKTRVLPKQFSDAIVLEPKIDVPNKISKVLEKMNDSESNMRLAACGSLIEGMLLSDGITVFGTDGTVRAYNVFVKHPPEKSAEVTAGGARSRTLAALSGMLNKGLHSAFMQSQDGRVECVKKGQS